MATKNELEIAKSLGSIETSIKNIETDIRDSNKKHAGHYKADSKMEVSIGVLESDKAKEDKKSLISGAAAGGGTTGVIAAIYWLINKFTGN